MTGHSNADVFNADSTTVNLKVAVLLILTISNKDVINKHHVSWYAKTKIEQL